MEEQALYKMGICALVRLRRGSEVVKHLLYKFQEEVPSVELRATSSLLRGEAFIPSMTYTGDSRSRNKCGCAQLPAALNNLLQNF